MAEISGVHINAHATAVISRSLAINKCIKNYLRGFVHVSCAGKRKKNIADNVDRKFQVYIVSYKGRRVYPDKTSVVFSISRMVFNIQNARDVTCI